MHNLRSQRRGPRRTSAGCPEAGDEEQAWQIGDISCAREYSAAIALAILIAAICFKQTEKFLWVRGCVGPFWAGVAFLGAPPPPFWKGRFGLVPLWLIPVGGVWAASEGACAESWCAVGLLVRLAPWDA